MHSLVFNEDGKFNQTVSNLFISLESLLAAFSYFIQNCIDVLLNVRSIQNLTVRSDVIDHALFIAIKSKINILIS